MINGSDTYYGPPGLFTMLYSLYNLSDLSEQNYSWLGKDKDSDIRVWEIYHSLITDSGFQDMIDLKGRAFTDPDLDNLILEIADIFAKIVNENLSNVIDVVSDDRMEKVRVKSKKALRTILFGYP